MSMTDPHPISDSNNHLLCQTFLCRTYDNRYLITKYSFDSTELKYFTDTVPTFFGDTFQIPSDSDKYVFIHEAGLDLFLKSFYDNDDSVRYETLRTILLEYPTTKPCEYWDADDDDDNDYLDIGMMTMYYKNNTV